jgi:hypothetical protein
MAAGGREWSAPHVSFTDHAVCASHGYSTETDTTSRSQQRVAKIIALQALQSKRPWSTKGSLNPKALEWR